MHVIILIHNIINSTGCIHVGSIVFRTSAEIFGALTIYNSVIPWPRGPIGKHYKHKHTEVQNPRCQGSIVVQHVYTFLFYPVSIDSDFRVQHSWVALASYCICVRIRISWCARDMHVINHTSGQTDRQTDGRTDRKTCCDCGIPPPTLRVARVNESLPCTS